MTYPREKIDVVKARETELEGEIFRLKAELENERKKNLDLKNDRDTFKIRAVDLEVAVRTGIADIRNQLAHSNGYAKETAPRDHVGPTVWELQNGHVLSMISDLEGVLLSSDNGCDPRIG
jgi:hypothetical protein